MLKVRTDKTDRTESYVIKDPMGKTCYNKPSFGPKASRQTTSSPKSKEQVSQDIFVRTSTESTNNKNKGFM